MIDTYLKLFSLLAMILNISGVYIPPGPRFRCPKQPETIYPCHCIKESDVGLYIHCENSNLAMLSVAFQNMEKLDTMVENITIYKCHLEKLYGTLFYRLKARVLILHRIPIKTIEEHTFYGINRTLQVLQILESNLQEFPASAFKVLGNLTSLKLDGHQIQTINKNILSDSMLPNKLEELVISNGNINELFTESFQALRKIKQLDLHGNSISVLKKNQFKNLRELEILDLSFNNISKLDGANIADLIKLTVLNMSHNNLLELTRGTFGRNTFLKVLNLSFNKIKKLDLNSFRGMRFLRRLYLSDNLLSDIGRGTFGSMSRIGTIDLARNQLQKIGFQMFAQLNYAELIDVAENNITLVEKQSFKDLFLTKINISHNGLEIIENFAFENCANITELDISNNHIKYIPRDAFDPMTYATEIQLPFNYLNDLSQIPLHNMTGLKILNVSYNNLALIPKNTFPKLYELHTIDASHNNISFIGGAVFQSLFSLRNLNLSYNQMQKISFSVFGTIPTLLNLNLGNNKIKTISQGALTQLISLRSLNLENNMLEKLFQIPISLSYLNLRNNWLQDITEGTWPIMNSLLSLDLSGNRLGNNLKSDSFTGLLTLQQIHLGENSISIIPAEALRNLPTLQYLNLQKNNITILPKAAFGKLPIVFVVDLHENNINKISVKAFDGLLQLLTLNLSGNSLKDIPNEAFLGLVSLRKLDLSFNLLEKLDNKTNGILEDCLSLEHVNLSHNKISFITKKMFPSNPYVPYKLMDIDLSYNSLPTLNYDIIYGTKKLKKLNVSHNYIQDIRKGVLKNLTALTSLDLSSNELGDLQAEESGFDLPKNLTDLYLQDNKINKIKIEELLQIKNLSYINLQRNKLQYFPIELIEKLKKGHTILYDGNPLKCDCSVRPLKHYFLRLTYVPRNLSAITCFLPSFLSMKSLVNVSDELLLCNSDKNITKYAADYDILPDIKFREILYGKGELVLNWFVSSNKDVGEFYVNVRDKQNNIYFEQNLSYDKRSISISGDIIREAVFKSDFVQVCVLAKTSEGLIGGWYDSQCFTIPDKFISIWSKYQQNFNSIYTFMSRSPKRSMSKIFLRSSTENRLKFSVLTLLAALIIKVCL